MTQKAMMDFYVPRRTNVYIPDRLWIEFRREGGEIKIKYREDFSDLGDEEFKTGVKAAKEFEKGFAGAGYATTRGKRISRIFGGVSGLYGVITELLSQAIFMDGKEKAQKKLDKILDKIDMIVPLEEKEGEAGAG